MRILALRMAVLAAAVAVACATGPDDGSESNFWSCDTQKDCSALGSDALCVHGRCLVVDRLSSAPDAGGPCDPAACPTGPGLPCCVGPSGPCGLDVGGVCQASGSASRFTSDARAAFTDGGVPRPVCDLGEVPLDPAALAPDAGGGCTLALPTPPSGQKLDTQRLNLATTIAGRPVPLASVSFDASHCNDDPEGFHWYFDDNFTPHAIILCPKLCGATASRTASPSFVFGCPTVQGVMPGPIAGLCKPGMVPVPVSPVELAVGGCGFTLSSSLDPQIKTAGFAIMWQGTAILPHLPTDDPASCQAVADGWYYGDPKHPSEARLCPQSCALERSNPLPLELLVGCGSSISVCETSSDCAGGLVCAGGKCVQCIGDSDCPSGMLCWANECVSAH